MIGHLVHSACNDMARRAYRAAGRNYHAEKLAAERERMNLYYVALFAEIERCRAAQVPTLIGEHSIPRAPTTDIPYGVQGREPSGPCTFPNCKGGQCCMNPSNARPGGVTPPLKGGA